MRISCETRQLKLHSRPGIFENMTFRSEPQGNFLRSGKTITYGIMYPDPDKEHNVGSKNYSETRQTTTDQEILLTPGVSPVTIKCTIMAETRSLVS